MLKKISLQDAVGTELAHDITEIRPGGFKGAAFRKGHTVCNEDICHLQKLGKKELAFFGHGGLCQDCRECVFPECAFGKGA